MPLFPAFLKLAGRRCLIVGAGPIAEEKITGLLLAKADIRVVAPRATSQIRAWARAKKIRWDARPYLSADLTGAFLVIAATSSPDLHATIYADARRRAVLCNVVDDPEHCDFYYGAVVRRGALQIAISTEGHSPSLAQRLKKKIAREIGPEYESWLAEIGEIRKQLFAERNMPPARRKKLLHHLASEASFRKFQRRKKSKRKLRRNSH
ncbi:MAG TPA: bifunctional precorrin-2 dehydrogenase/sirohydrochlorin ferrochelatase [Candidatus Dormibacteraeota bacterium]|nr:bifunctional precorrin-2 dehydrogenase/sirohydrochlorin ferrochelatase [Candidatus Dormibacteraeota bacterium]